jgi:hypothetical protein
MNESWLERILPPSIVSVPLVLLPTMTVVLFEELPVKTIAAQTALGVIPRSRRRV